MKNIFGFRKFQEIISANVNKGSTYLHKLKLNDSSFKYEIESNKILGCGFRCGFLGMLHLEIIQERLIKEYNINLL